MLRRGLQNGPIQYHAGQAMNDTCPKDVDAQRYA